MMIEGVIMMVVEQKVVNLDLEWMEIPLIMIWPLLQRRKDQYLHLLSQPK